MKQFTPDPVGSTAATMRAVRPGTALIAGLLAVVVGAFLSLAGPSTASAATLEPCAKTQPTGPIITIEGEGTLTPVRATRKALKRSRVKQKLIRPAKQSRGRPEFPVRSVRYGKTSKIGLKGGIRFNRGRRVLKATKLVVVVPPQKKKPTVVKARLGGRLTPLFQVRGSSRKRKTVTEKQVTAWGKVRLTAKAARKLNRKLKLKRKRKFRVGASFGRFNLYSYYSKVQVKDPVAETPVEPPAKAEPAGAGLIATTATTSIKWHLRDSWVDYVSSGRDIYATNGATADPPTGSKNLTYSFNFEPDPDSPGWTQPGSGNGVPDSSLIKGKGTVGFRFCEHTINFTVSAPEIEIDGDDNSRMIFRVNGTDGTHFPNSRAVMVKLMPGQAAPPSTTDNGDGTETVAYTKIPGYIPAEGTGIFADFYPAYNPGKYAEENPRPDRFGSLDITYTYNPN